MDKNSLIPSAFLDENRNKNVTYPIYQYTTKKGERLRIVYDGKTYTGYTNWDNALEDYLALSNGTKTPSDLRNGKKKKPVSKITFREAAQEYYKSKKANYEGEEIRYSTLSKMESNIRLHMIPYFGEKIMTEITAADVMDYSDMLRSKELSNKIGRDKKYHPLSASNINQVILYFRAIFKYASIRHDFEIRFDLNTCLPYKKTTSEKIKIQENLSKFLSDLDRFKSIAKRLFEKIAEMKGGIFNQVFALLFLGIVLGTRIDELTALTPLDFDEDSGTLLINKSITWHPDKSRTSCSYEINDGDKTWNKRVLVLPRIIVRYLSEYIKILKENGFYSDTRFIFARNADARDNRHSSWPYSLKTIDYQREQAMKSIAKEDGIDISTKKKYDEWYENNWFNNHTLRHFENNYMQEHDIDRFDRNSFLGHSNGNDIDSTYLVFKKKGADRIVEINDELCRFLVKDIQEFKKMLD